MLRGSCDGPTVQTPRCVAGGSGCATSQPGANEGRNGRRLVGYVLTALVPILVAAGVTWYLAPGQEKRVQRSIQADEQAQQASRPPLAVEYAADTSFNEPDSLVLPTAPSPALAAYLGRRDLDEQHLKSLVHRDGGIEVVTVDGLDLSNRGRTSNKLRVTLVGRSPDPVLVTDISARIVARAAPWPGGGRSSPHRRAPWPPRRSASTCPARTCTRNG